MTCTCGSERIMTLSAKCSDMCYLKQGSVEHEGSLLNIGIGSGDYVAFKYCLDCGRIQPENKKKEWVPQEDLKQAIRSYNE